MTWLYYAIMDHIGHTWVGSLNWSQAACLSLFYNLFLFTGNYCPIMLEGRMCKYRRDYKRDYKCDYCHYFAPNDAVTQFYRIAANKPLDAVLTFTRFFTDPKIQESLAEDARELLGGGDLGDYYIDNNIESFHDPMEICRGVFRAVMARTSELGLECDHLVQMMKRSTELFNGLDLVQAVEVLVPLMHQLTLVIVDFPLDRKEVVHWAWTQLYLPHLNQGSVLPQQFYSDLCTLLSSNSETLPQLSEVLLYSSLLPSLVPCLTSLQTLLTTQSSLYGDTAILTAKCLAHLRDVDWRSLDLARVLPGLKHLSTSLQDEDPEDVAKFYSSLPEIEGLDIPSLHTSLQQKENEVWIASKLSEGSWAEISGKFAQITRSEVEEMAEFIEYMVEEVERLGETGRLRYPLVDLFQLFVSSVETASSQVLKLFVSQLGLSLMVLLCRAQAWMEAGNLLRNQFMMQATDFTTIKLPAVGIFLDLNKV